MAIIDRPDCVGGICIHHGAIPSKSLREAILYFTGFYHRQTYGARHQKDLTMRELMNRCAQVESNETQVILDQLDLPSPPPSPQGATELIHIGQTAMAFNGTIDYFIENTFNYPTLAECYRVAGLNGYNKIAVPG